MNSSLFTGILKTPRVLIISLLLASQGLAQASMSGETMRYQDLQITRSGLGRDFIFIPGLNSSAEVFSEVCAEINLEIRCHLLQLPGFAGLPPVENIQDGFMQPMRDQIISYIDAHNLEQSIIVGHSLGGVLALMLTEQSPQSVSALALVDSLPFLPAAQNPAASAATMEPIANQMRTAINTQTREQFEAAVPLQLVGMSTDSQRMPTLIEWSRTSDPATMAQAMYELYTTDLRDRIETISTPTLVLGSWAAYEQFGATAENTLKRYQAQYQKMPNLSVSLSESGYHFLMWDDKEWLLQEIHSFIQAY